MENYFFIAILILMIITFSQYFIKKRYIGGQIFVLDLTFVSLRETIIILGKGKVCIRAHVAHQAGAYPGFRSMKRLGVFLLPPGWDVSPSQGYPPALSLPVPIYTLGWREAL